MDYDFEYLNVFFIILWFVIFVFCSFIEYKIKDIDLLHYGLGALTSGICGLIFATIFYQAIIFVISIIVFRILLNSYYRKKQTIRIFENQICTYIGREAIVSKPIDPNHIGEVRIFSTTWEAICGGDYSLEEGELVLITGKSGVNLVVSKIKY